MMLRAVVVSVVALLVASDAHVVRDAVEDAVEDADADRYAVPEGILWGAGVSALQTEGAWDEDGKAESAADHVILFGNLSVYSVTHKVAADSYHKYMEDVAMAAQLKLKLYKFSMSWSRVLPEADASKPNALGVAFYHKLIDAIVAHNMTPMVTIYHFDHPQILEDQFKGWQSRQMVDKFAEYSKFVFEEYGTKVPLFVTINEPNMYCAYFTAQYVAAGFRTLEEVDPYECIHNNILAHRAAYKIYQDGKYMVNGIPGKVGYSALLMAAEPTTTTPEDVYAADMFNQIHAGTSLGPVVYGDYPQSIRALLGDKLPRFTEAEKAELADSTDFIGLNIYFGVTTAYNRFMNSSSGAGVMGMVLGQMTLDIPFVDVAMKTGSSGPMAAFTTIDPTVMKNALMWTWQSYKKPIVITENGYGDLLHLGIQDTQRSAYHSAFLRSLVATVKDYDVQVLAYSAWSLIDSYEFTAGFNRPFGLVHVDYESGSLTRSLKDSSKFWIQLAETNVVPYVENPDDATTLSPAATTRSPPATTRSPPATTRSPPATTPRNSASSPTMTMTILPLALFVSLLLTSAV